MKIAIKIILSVLALAQFLAAQQAACKPMLDAEMKTLDTPVHLYVSSATHGQTTTVESIYAGGHSYVKVNDKWSSMGETASFKDMMQKKRQQSSSAVCSYVKDEAVNGEVAAVYNMTAVLAHGGKLTSQMWISKSKGLTLRQEDDIETSRGTTHNSTRYEYSNVKPPM